MPSTDGDQIITNGQGNFILIWPVSFVQPWLPLYREPCASFSADAQSFFLRRAVLVAFLMFPLRGGLLFSSHKFTQPDLRGRIFCSPRATLHLSGDAFVCALLSSRQPSGNVQSVALPRALRVSTMPVLMLSDGSRA
jgi:hypothetical protein